MVYYPGGPNADTLVGSDAADIFEGEGGDDIIYPLGRWAGGSRDLVQGGAGVDTIRVDASAEILAITALQFLGGWELKSNSNRFGILADDDVERVEITSGSGKDTLQGLFGNDILRGGTGNDTLDGSYGYDLLDGGTGIDTVDQRFWNGPINANLTSGRTTFPGDPNFDTLISIENFYSGNGADTLTGNAAVNVLHAGGGNDIVNGLGGNDRLFGADGNDRLNGGDHIDELSGGMGNDVLDGLNGNDRLFGAAGDDRLNGGNDIDQLYGGTDDDELLGGAAKDLLKGEGGNDDLAGGPGGDVLDGGLGSDTINGGAGFDTASFESYNGRTIVNLTTGRAVFVGRGGFDRLIAVEDVVTGDANDTITGNGVRNILIGGGGSDTLNGQAGNDILAGDEYGPLGVGRAGADILNGGIGDDVLRGGAGRDKLTGGFGRDTFYGGEDDADRFIFTTTKDSLVGINRDVIRDFERAFGDVIDLKAIDANLALDGDQAFKFIRANEFSGTRGELNYVAVRNGVIVGGDVTGDGEADFQIRVDRVLALDAGDFEL